MQQAKWQKDIALSNIASRRVCGSQKRLKIESEMWLQATQLGARLEVIVLELADIRQNFFEQDERLHRSQSFNHRSSDGNHPARIRLEDGSALEDNLHRKTEDMDVMRHLCASLDRDASSSQCQKQEACVALPQVRDNVQCKSCRSVCRSGGEREV